MATLKDEVSLQKYINTASIFTICTSVFYFIGYTTAAFSIAAIICTLLFYRTPTLSFIAALLTITATAVCTAFNSPVWAEFFAVQTYYLLLIGLAFELLFGLTFIKRVYDKIPKLNIFNKVKKVLHYILGYRVSIHNIHDRSK
jgi:hypothetical protein